jgi:hypothetical protein
MKEFAVLFGLLFLLCFPTTAQNKPIRQEITKGEIKTLINTQSERLSIMGLNLSMTVEKAQAFLNNSDRLIGERDDYNLGRIYVYEKTTGGGKGKALLYLIWDGRATMKQLTVFEDFKSYLNNDFKKLLTMEALDQNSQFTKNFIGKPDRSAVTLDIQSTGYKHITYYFDKIGLELTRKIDNGKDVGVVFALVPSKPKVKKRKWA